MFILNSEELALKFEAKQLLVLEQKYGKQIYINASERVYKTLEDYGKFSENDKKDIEFFSFLTKAKLEKDELLVFAKKNIQTAAVVIHYAKDFFNKFFYSSFLREVINYYEVIGLKLIKNEGLIRYLNYADCCQLALSSEKLCMAILQTEELSVQFDGEQLLALVSKFGEVMVQIINSCVLYEKIPNPCSIGVD